MTDIETHSRATIVFAPGAGAPSSSEWMQGFRQRLDRIGDVICFDYPYMEAGRRRPDLLPKLIEAHRAVVRRVRTGRSDATVILAGKSMGSRVGCHVALEETVAGLVCFGYPLVSPQGRVRDEVLLRLSTPILFVQGTRDRLCPLKTLETVRAEMKAPSQLFVVDEGDHSLRITKRRERRDGITQDDVDREIVSVVAEFCRQRDRRVTLP